MRIIAINIPLAENQDFFEKFFRSQRCKSTGYVRFFYGNMSMDEFHWSAVNYLGIDYGRKRTGMSICHGNIGISLPIGAIISEDDGEKIAKICKIISRESVGEVVVGYPLRMDGSVGNKAKEVDDFIEKLSAFLPRGVKITRSDERLTSEQADSEATSIRGKQSPSKKKKWRKSGTTASNAAALI
jgi:putative Holliday junction resolvase